MRAAVLTLSDSCVAGQRVDESGPLIHQCLSQTGWEVVASAILADDPGPITAQLIEWADQLAVDLIVTTGGTGFSLRDNTPEATLAALDRRAPGIVEALRAEGLKHTPHACFSRGEAGLRGRTLIINLPGSVKAVREGLVFLSPILPHAIRMIAGEGH